MKNILILLAMMLPTATMAETADGDTVVIKKPREVMVVTNDSLQQIIVKGRAGDEGYVYKNTIQLVDSNYVSHTTVDHELHSLLPKVNLSASDSTKIGRMVMSLIASAGCGWVASHTDVPGMDFTTTGSYEIWFEPLSIELYLNKLKRDYLSLRYGFDWRNYRMDGDQRFLKDATGHTIIADYPEGSSPKFSRVKVFSMTGKLLYNHSFGHGLGIGLGVVGNWNTYASLKTRYRLDNVKCKEVEKHIGQRRFTLDYMAILRNPIIDFYVKYSPQSVLKAPGVKFHSVSLAQL